MYITISILTTIYLSIKTIFKIMILTYKYLLWYRFVSYLYFIIIYYYVHYRCTLYAFINIIIIIIIICHIRILYDNSLLNTTALNINYTLKSTRQHRFSPRNSDHWIFVYNRSRLTRSFRAFLLNNIIILCSNKDA